MDFIKKNGMLEFNFTKNDLLKHGLSPKDWENGPSVNLEKFIAKMMKNLDKMNLLRAFNGPCEGEIEVGKDGLKFQLKKLQRDELPDDVREVIENIITQQPNNEIDQKSSETVINKETTIYRGYWFNSLSDAIKASERFSCFSSGLLHTEFFKDLKTEMFYLWMEIRKKDEESLNGFLSLMLEYSKEATFPEYERAHLYEHGKLMIKEYVFEKLAYLAG